MTEKVFHTIGYIFKSILIFYFTRFIMPKRATSWQDQSLRHCVRATQLLATKGRSGGVPLATL